MKLKSLFPLLLLTLSACQNLPPELSKIFAPQPASATASPKADKTIALDDGSSLRLNTISFANIPGWAEDHQEEALKAFRASCVALLRMADDAAIRPSATGGTAADWKAPCQEAILLQEADAKAARSFFENQFTPYVILGEDASPAGFYTGYFEYSLKAEKKRTDKARHPIYAPPSDLLEANLRDFDANLPEKQLHGHREGDRFVPYHDRAAIDKGAIADKAQVLAWAYDPVDVFFMHIQGSGTVEFSNGEKKRLGFAARNGHPYHAIGSTLIEKGILTKETTNASTIADWLRANPDEAPAIMHSNPSYIFFEWKEEDGAVGAAGSVLTAGRSLAVDRAIIPLIAPVWVEAKEASLAQLMIAQDTGAAIKGFGRGDVFFGAGQEAADKAGHMQASGRMIILLPKKTTTSSTPQPVMPAALAP